MFFNIKEIRTLKEMIVRWCINGETFGNESGKNPELQKSSTHLQWRLVGDANWINLVALIDLMGANGKNIELQRGNTHLQWRLVGDTNWTNLVPIADLKGESGESARNPELQKSSTHLQWRLVGDSVWLNLVALAEISGTNGKSVELQKNSTHVQWRLVGDTVWINLIPLADLKGDPGSNGETYLKTISEVRAFTNASLTWVRITNKAKQGWLYYDASDTTSADDGVLTYVTSAGHRYKRWLGDTEGNVIATWWDADAATPTSDRTSTFQLAIDTAKDIGIGTVVIPAGTWTINGTLIVKEGVKLLGQGSHLEYYEDYEMPFGTRLIKPSADSVNGPIIQLNQQAQIQSMYLVHHKVGGANTGILRLGSTQLTAEITETCATDISIWGHITGTTSTSSTCYGVFFPDRGTTGVNYFNTSTVKVKNCDVGCMLGSLSNANRIDAYMLNCLVYFRIDGGTAEAIENNIKAHLFATVAATPIAICFQLRNSAKNNTIYYQTECYGRAFEIDSTSTGNVWHGQSNEAEASYIPTHNVDGNMARPVNVHQYTSMLLKSRSTGDAHIFGRGATHETFQRITGNLPKLDNNTGNITANDNSKIIIRFGSNFWKKSEKPNFRIHIEVYANTPYGAGIQFAEVDAVYRVTDTGTAAAQFSILEVKQKGSNITGLHFVKSTSSPSNGFGIALTGGNYGDFVFNNIYVKISLTALSFNDNDVNFAHISTFSFVAETVTSADVTDAISLLTVADHTI